MFGPYLRYLKTDYSKNLWYGSVMIVHKLPVLDEIVLEVFHRNDLEEERFEFRPVLLDSFEDHSFFRFNLELSLGTDPGSKPKKYSYLLSHDHSTVYSFYVASRSDSYWRCAFYSCNGFDYSTGPEKQQEMGGLQPLWRDLLAKHEERPILVLIGGGDQVYADDVWNTPSLQSWIDLDFKSKIESDWTAEMDLQVSQFYFNLYCKEMARPVIRDALASIPLIAIWDDHDIFDGIGSYPRVVEECPIFRNIMAIAKRFYLLFQLQTNSVLAASTDGFIVGNGGQDPEKCSYSFIRSLGREMVIVGVDTRSERTRTQILSPNSWHEIFSAINEKVPLTTRHMLFMTGVPVLSNPTTILDEYLLFFENIKIWAFSQSSCISNILAMLTNCFSGPLSIIGTPEYSDDFIDQWSHRYHTKEREFILEQLQSISMIRNVRVTFIAGDAHCASLGRFYNGKQKSLLDHKCMYQIVSSAIGNAPPPEVALNLRESYRDLGWCASDTRSENLEVFLTDFEGHPSKMKKFMGSRNYCLIEGAGRQDNEGASSFLRISLQVENAGNFNAPSKTYPFEIPHPQ